MQDWRRCRRSLLPASVVLLVVVGGCQPESQPDPASETTASQQPTDHSPTSRPPSNSPSAGSTASDAATAASPSSPVATTGALPAGAPTGDPSDPDTLVGVWQTSDGLEVTLNDRGYFGVVAARTGERYDSGTWQIQDGALVLITTIRVRCFPEMTGTYDLPTGPTMGTLVFESVSDECRGRREDLDGGLTWLRPDE